jgi:hypothetical protein
MGDLGASSLERLVQVGADALGLEVRKALA